MAGSLAALGCGEKPKPPPKVETIGGGGPLAKKDEAKKVGLVGGPGDAGPPAQPAATSSESPKRTRKKTAEQADLDEDEEPVPGKQLYAVLPQSAPGGVPFAVDGASVDLFAFVPGDPKIDSTMFAYEKQTGALAVPGVGYDKDDSRTEYELPEGFTPIEITGESRSGLPWRIRSDADGAVMALVPEGVLVQGSNAGPPEAAPEHGVLLDAFYIDLREVTSARYENFREASAEKTKVRKPSRVPKDPHEPVLGVTWAEAH
ncbi:MAG TPA: SUMF1/EgtB/PvdO family nonheme iron enzyme, partial [Planctomycetaceae bacterium]